MTAEALLDGHYREHVSALFDRHAADFEPLLLGSLQYETPAQLERALLAFVASTGASDGVLSSTACLDLGCGTGLSMYMLTDKWSSIETVTGVDMSPYKLAICEEKKSEMTAQKAATYNLFHGAAETTGIPSESQDLVSLCLVAHESPAWVSKAIFAEAYRILKPGGSFTMLDLDKENLENLLENPFVAAIYKQTEPYMGEFLKL
jgi:ubiquinone/menaquinone biosynthesis C-methylase UbiE